jgi:hypothetical protein
MKGNLKLLLQISYFLVTVLILSALAFYNKLPLLYPDSGTYLINSLSQEPSLGKAMGYTFFIHLVTWQATTWTIVLFQNLIISFLIFMFLKLFFRGRQLYTFHFITIIFLTIFSSLCWFSCLIMPDIFTPAMVLGVIIFMISEKISVLQYILYLLLITLFLTSHLTILLLLFFLIVPVLAFLYLKNKPKEIISRMIRRCYALFATGMVAILILCTYNYAQGLGFKLSHTTNMMLTAKFCNTGLLKRYLDDKCKTGSECVLCQYKDSLPGSSDEFLWSDHSPLYNYKHPVSLDEPWLKAEVAYAPIVKDILSTPAYYPKLIKDAVKYTWDQMISIKISTGKIPFGVNSAPYYPYRDRFPNDLNQFFNSLQNKGNLHFGVFEIFNRLSVILSLILILIGIFYVKPDFVLWFTTAIIALSLLENAFITSVLSVVEDRYQSRIVWLLPLLAIVFLFKIILKKKDMKQS